MTNELYSIITEEKSTGIIMNITHSATSAKEAYAIAKNFKMPFSIRMRIIKSDSSYDWPELSLLELEEKVKNAIDV
jgi:hypothetical protein